MIPKIPFNEWSIERLKLGVKCCTSRTKMYKVAGVTKIEARPLSYVRDNLWREEGANSPEEFVEVWKSIHPRAGWKEDGMVYVHWFENPNKEAADVGEK